jgi:hypothetical protein
MTEPRHDPSGNADASRGDSRSICVRPHLLELM